MLNILHTITDIYRICLDMKHQWYLPSSTGDIFMVPDSHVVTAQQTFPTMPVNLSRKSPVMAVHIVIIVSSKSGLVHVYHLSECNVVDHIMLLTLCHGTSLKLPTYHKF